MNKNDLLAAIAAKADVAKTTVDGVLTAFAEVVIEALNSDDEVHLVGLGKFTAVHRDARVARNPFDGSSVKVDAKYAPKFKPSVAFKDAVSGVKKKKPAAKGKAAAKAPAKPAAKAPVKKVARAEPKAAPKAAKVPAKPAAKAPAKPAKRMARK